MDWVVSKEFASLLQDHPSLRKVWAFDRRGGFLEWFRLCRELWLEGYDEVIDLHRSLRTRVAKFFFNTFNVSVQLGLGGIFGVQSSAKPKRFSWNARFSKQRIRFWGYCTFKSIWPQSWRPIPVVRKFAIATGGSAENRPDLSYLLKGLSQEKASEQLLPKQPYVCVMPSARWNGKKWPVRSFADAIQRLPVQSVILGTDQDRECLDLVRVLRERGILHLSGVGRWSLRELAAVLAGAEAYMGNDTGLAHFAEAVGTPAAMIFGPTTPDLGFGPWGAESRAVGSDLWCRPCGKDGRFCFRPTRRYLCLKQISAEQVSSATQTILSHSQHPSGKRIEVDRQQ